MLFSTDRPHLKSAFLILLTGRLLSHVIRGCLGHLLLLNSTGVISLQEPKPTVTSGSTGFLPNKQSGPWLWFCFLLNWGVAWKTQVLKKIQFYLKFVLESIQASMRYLGEFFLLCFLKNFLRYYVSQFSNIWTEKSLKNDWTYAFFSCSWI